jgi:hypothetical protein
MDEQLTLAQAFHRLSAILMGEYGALDNDLYDRLLPVLEAIEATLFVAAPPASPARSEG